MILTSSSARKPAELEEAVPITDVRGVARKVVMTLGRGSGAGAPLPKLEPRDQLKVTAEVEVTTDCREPGAGCYRNPGAGDEPHPYDYAPLVSARLLLCASPKATDDEGDDAIELGDARTAHVNHERHHETFVFADRDYEIPTDGLPWTGESYVNLVVDAFHEEAEPGDVLLIGENEPDGSVGRDKGRLNAIRRKPDCPEGTRLRTNRLRARSIPIETGRKPVVYSKRVGRLEHDDQLVVEALLATDAGRLNYPVRVSARLLLAGSKEQWDAEGEAANVAPFGGEIAEHNGFNFNVEDAIAETRKVGVLRARGSSRDDLYVNLVVDCGDPFERSLPGDVVEVLDDGYLSVTKFPAGLCG